VELPQSAHQFHLLHQVVAEQVLSPSQLLVEQQRDAQLMRKMISPQQVQVLVSPLQPRLEIAPSQLRYLPL
jgi:hypothetical protein